MMDKYYHGLLSLLWDAAGVIYELVYGHRHAASDCPLLSAARQAAAGSIPRAGGSAEVPMVGLQWGPPPAQHFGPMGTGVTSWPLMGGQGLKNGICKAAAMFEASELQG